MFSISHLPASLLATCGLTPPPKALLTSVFGPFPKFARAVEWVLSSVGQAGASEGSMSDSSGSASGPSGMTATPLPPGLTAHIMALARGPPPGAFTDGGPSSGHPARASSAPPPPMPDFAQLAAGAFAGGAFPGAASGSAAPSEAQERMQRLSSAVAGTIFSDLINGALRPGDAGPPPASDKAIENLDRNCACEAGASCPICLCELTDSDEGTTQMPCKHAFHDSCLTKWLKSHNTCPVCRSTVEADETPRPNSLSAFLNGWREQQQQRLRAEAEGGASSSSGRSASQEVRAPTHCPIAPRLAPSTHVAAHALPNRPAAPGRALEFEQKEAAASLLLLFSVAPLPLPHFTCPTSLACSSVLTARARLSPALSRRLAPPRAPPPRPPRRRRLSPRPSCSP